VPDALRGRAPAKVNLVLEVLGARDDGFHEIDTIFQELEIADEVAVTFGGPAGIRVDGPFAAGTPTDQTNLAWRAAALLADRTGESAEGISIGLTKNIPPAGGLGGGASDAATMLRLLAGVWPRTTDAILRQVGGEIGSDEAFFLVGGTARGTGRGEKIEPLSSLLPHDVVLFVPPFSIERKTARMFAALDHHAFDPGGIASTFAIEPPRHVRSADVFNAFERVVFDLFPPLAALWQDLEARTGEPVRLAGAGPTLFWIGPSGSGEAVARSAAGAGCTVIPTRTARVP
jgi:4-diphosphocytidyl-2-C-methyl-D-erythritol kinase